MTRAPLAALVVFVSFGCTKTLPAPAERLADDGTQNSSPLNDASDASDGAAAPCDGTDCGEAPCKPGSQQWEKVLPAPGTNSAWVSASAASSAGSFHAVAVDPKPDFRFMRAMRLDATGKVTCDEALPLSGYDDTLTDARGLPGGDVAVVGHFREHRTKNKPSWSSSFWLMRIDATCEVKWDKRLGLAGGYNRGYSVTVDGDRLVAVGAWADKADSTAHRRPTVMALSAQTGAVVWQKSYPGIFATWITTIPDTYGGGYAVTGRDVDPDAWLMRVDTEGKTLWRHNAPNTDGNDDLLRVVVMANGDFVTSGRTSGSGAGKNDLWVVRFDPVGKVLWQATFGGPASEITGGLTAWGDDVLLSGATASFGAGSEDGWLIRVDPKGKQRWAKTFGTTDAERFEHLFALPSGGFMATGSQNLKPWVVRVDDCGDL